MAHQSAGQDGRQSPQGQAKAIFPPRRSVNSASYDEVSRSVSTTHRELPLACERLLHLESAVRQFRRRFFPLPPRREVDGLLLASTVEWAGRGQLDVDLSFPLRPQPEPTRRSVPQPAGVRKLSFAMAGNFWISRSGTCPIKGRDLFRASTEYCERKAYVLTVEMAVVVCGLVALTYGAFHK